jgi:DNA helicase-2/ATP-dependent DNA helicase PcrA
MRDNPLVLVWLDLRVHRVLHKTFGEGEMTHVLGKGRKTTLAVSFSGLGKKILDPKVAPMEQV